MPAFEESSHPHSPAQITPAFLAPILRSAGVVQQATITAIEVEPLVAAASFNAQLARLHLTYDRHEAGTPGSLIVKLPTVNPVLQQNAAVFQPGLKEGWFYRLGAARTPVNVPACYYQAVDAATGESVLLLEDLAPARAGNRKEGASVEEAALALQSLARLHAAWWAVDPAEDPALRHLTDITQEAQELVTQLYRAAWPRFLERAALPIPDDVRRLGEYLKSHISDVEALLEPSPRTLIHGDFRLENILFGARDGQPVCWVVDWEDVLVGNGMLDVAWFLGSGLPVTKSAMEAELVRGYHQALVHTGVGGYSWPQCYHDFRCAMLSSFVQGVLTVAALESADEDIRRLADVLTERFVAAYKRLRLQELISASST